MEGHKLASHLWEAEGKPKGRACGAGVPLPWLDGVRAALALQSLRMGGERGTSVGPVVFIRHSESASSTCHCVFSPDISGGQGLQQEHPWQPLLVPTALYS